MYEKIILGVPSYALEVTAFDTVSGLRTVPTADNPDWTIRALALIFGSAAVFDATYAFYLWNPTDASADDGVNIIKPTAIVGPGRWNIISGSGGSVTTDGPAVLYSSVVDFTTLDSVTVPVVAGHRFYLEECLVIADTIVGLTSQPTVSFGNGTDPIKYQDNVATTLLTASDTRERFEVNGTDGETVLTAKVDVVAGATTFEGKFGFRGIIYPV